MPALFRSLSLLAVLASLTLLAPSGATATDLTAEQWLRAGAEQLTARSALLELRLVQTKNGKEREVRLETATSRRDPKMVKTWILQHTPEIQAGMQFLTLATEDGEEQYRYVPVTRAVGRVNPTENFSLFGTDFQIRDISVADPSEGQHRIVGTGEVEIGGLDRTVTIVESTYDSGRHRKVVRFLDSEHKLPLRVEYYGKAGDLEKRLTVLEVKTDAPVPVATHSRMESIDRGSATDLFVDSYRFDLDEAALPESTFTKEHMLEVGKNYDDGSDG